MRRHLRDALAALSAKERSDCSKQICDRLALWIPAQGIHRHISIYSALSTEVDLSPLVHALDRGFRFSYPLVVGKSLQFFHVPNPAELQKGAFEILEPDPRIHVTVPLEDIDLCLCPGLGFSPQGTRLGRGRGYYDSILPALRPEVLRVGVGFSLQIRASLPREDHDFSMSHLATEDGITPTRAAAS